MGAKQRVRLMTPDNLIPLKPADFLPRWKWTDLENILAQAIPVSRPQLSVLLEGLKLDAAHMTSDEVLSDLLVAIRAAQDLKSSCRDGGRMSSR